MSESTVASKASESSIVPVNLRCEYLVNPLGLDVPKPRFSWILESSRREEYQRAYQILVASSEEKLDKNNVDKWDSGKVESAQSANLPYKGSVLTSGEKCYWKVRVWDKDDNVSEYSTPAMFEMGFLKESDWEGKWIGAKKNISAPLFRLDWRSINEG